MDRTYINLHTHTHFSALDGLPSAIEYAERAKALGMPALSTTDHGNISGWLSFYDACKDNDIKPILGEEFYFARKTRYDRDDEERAGRANDELIQRGPYHLTVLAKNMVGYKNLIKLSSEAFLTGFYGKPRADFELLETYKDGLIVGSGCLNGIVQQALLRNDYDYALNAASRMQDIVGRENYFIEIQDHGLPEQHQVRNDTVHIAQVLNAPVIATCDSHFTYREQSDAHDNMICVSTKSLKSAEQRFKFYNDQFYLKSYEEMAAVFPEEWLTNSLAVGDQIELELDFGKLHFPEYPLPPNVSVDEYLDQLVYEGCKYRFGDSPNQEVLDRLDYELKVIRKMSFQHYFLVVWDILKFCRQNQIRSGFGRGSAASSMVSYCLQITQVNPIEYGLLFERFLIDGRQSPPDIDIDIMDTRRDEVIAYVQNKYGYDHVANIATFSTIGARQAIKDAARVLGHTFQKGQDIANLVPPMVLGKARSLDQALESDDMLTIYQNDDDARTIIDAAKGLEGLIRQDGMHAAGVVITPKALMEYIPVMRKPTKSGKDGPIVTQWNMHEVDRCGILKIDFLGLRNLTIIDNCLRIVEKKRKEVIDIYSLPLDDGPTYKHLQEGHTLGIFQLDGGSGITDLTMSMHPTTIEDIMALIALYRPGPMGSGMDKMYVERKNGRQKVRSYHSLLDETLKETHNLIVYQEDVLNIAKTLAGMDPIQRDSLRKDIGKKLPEKIKLLRKGFVEGCIETSGIDANTANAIFNDIEHHAGYSFNKAHSISYGMICFCTAYLKVHYPAEYMAALLGSIDAKDKMPPYIRECKALGIDVLSPSINLSDEGFTVVADDQIRFGLNAIDGIGKAVIRPLNATRDPEFTNMYDFMRRVDPIVLNKKTLESFIGSGTLDELLEVPQKTKLLSRTEKLEILNQERQRLGLYITDHPLDSVWHLIKPMIDSNSSNLANKANQTANVGGLLIEAERRITKSKAVMYRLVLEDEYGIINILVFNRVVDKLEKLLQLYTPLVFKGKVRLDGDSEHAEPILIAYDCTPLVFDEYSSGSPIILNLKAAPSMEVIEDIERLIDKNPGDSYLYIRYNIDNFNLCFKFKKPTDHNIKSLLERCVSLESVR